MENRPLTQTQVRAVQQLVQRVGRGLRDTAVTSIREKAPLDVVSDLDLWAEGQIVQFLSEHFPGDSILCEESANEVAYADRMWVLDPLDGTVNRTVDLPFYSVSLALLVNGSPYFGLVFDPERERLYSAVAGQGAWLGDQRLNVREDGVRPVALTNGTLNLLRDLPSGRLAAGLEHLGKMRNLGSQAMHLAYVAAGHLSAAVSVETRLWDNAAGALLVTEAGGTFTDIEGKSPFPLALADPVLHGGCSSCIAAPPGVHGPLTELFASR